MNNLFEVRVLASPAVYFPTWCPLRQKTVIISQLSSLESGNSPQLFSASLWRQAIGGSFWMLHGIILLSDKDKKTSLDISAPWRSISLIWITTIINWVVFSTGSCIVIRSNNWMIINLQSATLSSVTFLSVLLKGVDKLQKLTWNCGL